MDFTQNLCKYLVCKEEGHDVGESVILDVKDPFFERFIYISIQSIHATINPFLLWNSHFITKTPLFCCGKFFFLGSHAHSPTYTRTHTPSSYNQNEEDYLIQRSPVLFPSSNLHNYLDS